MPYLQSVSANTRDYLFQQFPQLTPAWLASFNDGVQALVDKWQLSFSAHEHSSRFGAILYGTSALFGDVALKIVPGFSPRLRAEIACYRELPYREMCPLYAADEDLGALLLRYVPPIQANRSASREAVFRRLYAQRRPFLPEDEALLSLFPRYEAVLKDVLARARREVESQRDENLLPFLPSIELALDKMENFAAQPRFVIHGDAHEYNMLMDGENCVLIDPLGYIAPFEFEYARYLGTAMKSTSLSRDEMASLLKRLLPAQADPGQALAAFAIDVTLRACNTFIEGNTYEEICQGADWAHRAWRYVADLARI